MQKNTCVFITFNDHSAVGDTLLLYINFKEKSIKGIITVTYISVRDITKIIHFSMLLKHVQAKIVEHLHISLY